MRIKVRFNRAAKTASKDGKLLLTRDDLLVETEEQLVNNICEEEYKRPISRNLNRERATELFDSLNAKESGSKLEFCDSRSGLIVSLKVLATESVVVDGEKCVASKCRGKKSSRNLKI